MMGRAFRAHYKILPNAETRLFVQHFQIAASLPSEGGFRGLRFFTFSPLLDFFFRFFSPVAGLPDFLAEGFSSAGYTFGESLSMGPDWVPLFKLRRKISYYLNAPIRFLSITQRWCMPFPNGRLVTVVGLPIDPGVVESEPSRDRVKELHGKYVESLLKMIEDTKEEAGYPMQVTVVV